MLRGQPPHLVVFGPGDDAARRQARDLEAHLAQPGLALFLPALLLELFFVGHYLATGSFSPHKWAGFSGAGLAVLALLVGFMGMIGDMLNRHRVYLEELLYEERRRGSADRGDAPRP